jgi:L-asparaginase II
MVAGTGRFDTRVMQHFGERVFCKVGAEGVHCAALPELGLGVAIKMDDGNNARACEVAQAAVLQRLLKQDDADAALLGRPERHDAAQLERHRGPGGPRGQLQSSTENIPWQPKATSSVWTRRSPR